MSMTEQEYMDITDLARLYAIQQILVQCNFEHKKLHEDVYKAMRILQLKTRNVIEITED